MEITVIHGSPRKSGNTHTATKLFMDALCRCGEVTFTEFYLPEAMPHFCRGCMTCVLEGEDKCPHATYTLPILNAMLRADALIFTTPVYVMSEAGTMKTFLDHFPYLYIVHRARKEMFSEKAFILCTTLGAGTKTAIKTIATSLRFWGVNRVYSTGFALHEVHWNKINPKRRAKIERKIDKKALFFYRQTALKKRRRPYLFLYFIVLFLRRMIAGYDDTSLDKQYWVEQGWLRQNPFRS